MAYEQKDNSGSLWINDRKQKDSHPDRTGTITVDGRHYYISGWLKKTQDGRQFLSLSVKPKDTGPRAAEKPPKEDGPNYEGPNDDIPF